MIINFRIRAPVSGCLPSPGPIANAFTWSTMSIISSSESSPSVVASVSGSGFVITSVNLISKIWFKLLATPRVTSPHPERSAPILVRTAAPVYPHEPASMRTCPIVPLCALEGLSGKRAATSSPSSRLRERFLSINNLSGKLISATVTFPAKSAPGYTNSPTLGRPKVTVSVPLTHTPNGTPLSASRPEGTSTHTTGLPQSTTAVIASASTPFIRSLPPIPTIASTTRLHDSSLAFIFLRAPRFETSTTGKSS